MAHPSAPQFSSSPSGDLRVPLAETAGRNGDPHADGKGPLRVSLMTRPNCAVNASHITDIASVAPERFSRLSLRRPSAHTPSRDVSPLGTGTRPMLGAVGGGIA